jgi:hypothetical protein
LGRTDNSGSPRAVTSGSGETKKLKLSSRSKSAATWLLLLLVRFYITFLSPFFGGGCRFHPSCSNYAHEAIARHGARRGFVLAFKRLLRCNPFVKGGFDPVPELAQSSMEQSSWAQGRQESAQ